MGQSETTPPWIGDLVRTLQVKAGSTVTLSKDFDPGYTADFVEKKEGVQLLAEGVELLAAYQDRLAAQDTHGLLLCLQGLDASGKDSTIRHVMSGVNPQGVRVSSFKVPSNEELRHDYLWRYAQRLPPAARSASSTARTTRKCSSSECTPSSWSRSASLERPPEGTSGSGASPR